MTAPLIPIREHFDHPAQVGSLWTLEHNGRAAECQLWSHVLGFELRLIVPGESFTRTHVCRTQDALIATQDEWRTALEAHGWTRKTDTP